ncbi:hypothetical protein [Thiothrix unzii]|jgi:hypothetical protein|uniref:hypothetical protein n=1 Tax=Thiothrix unzii TaxID=111769 RepID=UPI002A358ABA|nr:hypothetical protein [Thiothrix unzii]MDX9987927.1 hypothetical protein [Thiothrix unzii]
MIADILNNTYFQLILALASLIGGYTSIKQISTTDSFKDKKSKPSNENQKNPHDISIMIKKYDYHLYKAKTIYSAILAISITIFIGSQLLKVNNNIIDGYDKLTRGEELSESQKQFQYNLEQSREDLRIERNQMILIIVIATIIMFYIFIRPLILEQICKSLHNKTKYISERSDFRNLSESVNNDLKNYEFLNREVVDIVIKNFTRITKECYLHNLVQ